MVSQNETPPIDSQVPPVLDDNVESDSTDQEDGLNLPDPDIDLASLRENVSTAAAAALLDADLKAIRRATGHIPGLQSRLAAVEHTAKQVETLQATNRQLAARLDSLVTALSDASLITSGSAQALRPESNDSNADLLTKLSEMEERLTSGTKPEEPAEEDPQVAAVRAQWDAATEAVNGYAASKKFEEPIPDAVWQRALVANPSDPGAAALEVARYIDREIAAVSRRTERKDAASGGTGERTVRRGTITLDQLKSMSLAEVLAIPQEERDRIAAQGA